MTFSQIQANKMETANNVESTVNLNGFAKYKASTVLPSNNGWYKNKQETMFAPSMQELLFDLDSLQVNIDFDNDVKSSKKILSQFKAFKEVF